MYKAFLYKEHFNWHIYFQFFLLLYCISFWGSFWKKQITLLLLPTSNSSQVSRWLRFVWGGVMVDVTSIWIDFELLKKLNKGFVGRRNLHVDWLVCQKCQFSDASLQKQNKAIFLWYLNDFFPVVHLSTYTVIVSYQPNHFQIKFEKELRSCFKKSCSSTYVQL